MKWAAQKYWGLCSYFVDDEPEAVLALELPVPLLPPDRESVR